MTEDVLRTLQESKVAIFGTCRNAASTLSADLTRLDETTKIFGSRQYFLVESDSSDSTPDLLTGLSHSRPDFAAVSLGDLKAEHSLRTARIAHCRNIYRNAFFEDKIFFDCQYVIVADLDQINNRITSEKLLSCWSLKSDWGACTANRVGRYYDIFALRHPQWCPADCHDDFRKLEPTLGPALAKKICIEAKMITIPAVAKPIEVNSAFGGFAIYRREAFASSAPYVGFTENGQETCEHVSFSESICAAGHTIYINPAMTAGGIQEFVGKSAMRKSLALLGKLFN